MVGDWSDYPGLRARAGSGTPVVYPSAAAAVLPVADWPRHPFAKERFGKEHVVNSSSRAALDAFLAGVERRALRVAEIKTGARDEALDIVQDAMMQLARSYADRPPEEWPPLFYRILENKIRDWQRRQTVRRRLFGGWFAEQDAADDNDVDALAELPDPHQMEMDQELRQAQAMVILEKSLKALPARQREAFILRIWEGLSVEDTATAMGCSDGSVKTHLSRAMHALRAQLQGVWP